MDPQLQRLLNQRRQWQTDESRNDALAKVIREPFRFRELTLF